MQIQEFTKDLILSIFEAGIFQQAYVIINNLSNGLAMLLGILHATRLRARMIPASLAVIIERNISGALATVILFIGNGFSPVDFNNGVVVFPYVPLIAFVLAKLMKQPWKAFWDVMMVPPLIMFAGARIACTVCGCCVGYPCEWGIYNALYGTYLFPIQLLESFVTILILIAVFWREAKNNFVPDGRNVPIILISYGVSRFILEFLHNNQKDVLGLALTQYHCVIMILAGIIALRIIRRSEHQRSSDGEVGATVADG